MTTPEELCKYIMAKARGELVEERADEDRVWQPQQGTWAPSWQYRIAPKPKRKIVLRQTLLLHQDGSYWVPDRLSRDFDEVKRRWNNSTFIQWLGEPIELEVEDE